MILNQAFVYSHQKDEDGGGDDRAEPRSRSGDPHQPVGNLEPSRVPAAAAIRSRGVATGCVDT